MMYSAKDIEDVIYRYLPKEEGYAVKVISAMNYAFRAGGKRLRPMMMRLSYDMFCHESGSEGEEILGRFMAAMEMIHTYSLIHDDLPALDNDNLRRGKPTVHVAYGEDIAILAGDGLLNYAFETAAKAFLLRQGDSSVERAFAVLASKPGIYGMIGGQTLDVVMTGKELQEEELEYIYKNKTAALIEASMVIGAILAGADDASIKMMEEVGFLVGMAFQVQDDILDLIGNTEELGKPVGSDAKNKKTTYVTLHGIDQAKEYVSNASNRANQILNDLCVKKEEARVDLMWLISSLIERKN